MSASKGVRAAIPVFSSRPAVGGVEAIAASLHAALKLEGRPSILYEGTRQIVGSSRPAGPWFAATWKVHAAVSVRHPRPAHGGYLWVHGAELTRDDGILLPNVRRRCLTTAECLLAVSPLAKGILPPHLSSKLVLLGPPIEVGPAPAPKTNVSAKESIELLSIARATPRKGHDTAIRVARRLARRTPVTLRIVGPGPDLPRLQGLVPKGMSQLDVRFTGRVTDCVKAKLYERSDALLFLPRREGAEFEGLGLVVIEAAARGCPAVVLACGGSRYTVVAGTTGRLLREDASLDAIADAAFEVARSPKLRVGARAFAERFDAADWRRRLSAVLAGRDPRWEWPTCL